MQMELKVFIDGACPICAEARRLAKLAQQQLPLLQVALIDVTTDGTSIPEQVFAVPTYMLNGKTLWLGNPDEVEFIRQLQTAIQLS